MPVAKARRWTAREVRQLIADQPLATPRYELVDGELLVTPSPGPAHQEAVARLLGILRTRLGQGHQWRGTELTAKNAKSAKDCIVFGSGREGPLPEARRRMLLQYFASLAFFAVASSPRLSGNSLMRLANTPG